MDYFILGIIGIILGLIASLMGVGVGILTLLVFAYYLPELGLEGFELVRVIYANNSLFVGALFGILAIRYSRESGVSGAQLAKLTIMSTPVAVIISWSVASFDWLLPQLFYFFFCLSIAASIYTLITHRESSFLIDCQRSGQEKTSKLLGVGMLSGLFQGLIASESSTVLVPYLNRFCDLKIEKAIALATSSIAITLLAAFASYAYFIGDSASSLVQWQLLVPLWIGATIGGFLPFGMLSKVGQQLASYVLSFFLFIVALRLLFMEVLNFGI